MDSTWIVAANAGRARIFSQPAAGERLEEINDMVNTAVRLRTTETESDALGQRAASKSRHSTGAPTQPSGYEPNQSPAEHQTEIFARSVAGYLRQAQLEGRYRELVLTASPEFLGVLRRMLDPHLIACVGTQIDKDYTQLRPDELREQVRAHRLR